MSELRLKRIRFSKEADNWLKVLKSRTGLTPNILCRMGYCLSLEEPGYADPAKYDEASEREINRYTLLGEYDALLIALLRQRLAQTEVVPEVLDEAFRAHMNRGVRLLAGRLKSLTDLGSGFFPAPETSAPESEAGKRSK
jgi:DNA sulfur modification protein DndE